MKHIFLFISIATLIACDQSPKDNQSTKLKSLEEYVIDEVDLVPEGIAYSQKKDAFYLTSITKSKIIEVDRLTGKQQDFIGELEHGYSPGVGLLVDDERDLIHALGGYYTKDSISALYSFDINTHQLVDRYDCPEEGEHFYNDLIQDKKGNIYITDTKDSSVFMLKHGNDSLQMFYQSPEIKYPNGIAISDDNTKLYIAATSGVRVLDINTQELLNGKDSLGISQGIDGLEFFKDHLYAVQNGVIKNTDNLRKLLLNPTQDSIIGFEIIESNSPKLDVPLTFCIEHNNAVVIGNSNLDYLDQETQIILNPDTILNTKLIVYKL